MKIFVDKISKEYETNEFKEKDSQLSDSSINDKDYQNIHFTSNIKYKINWNIIFFNNNK